MFDRSRLLVLLLFLVGCDAPTPQPVKPISIVAWNIESGGSNPDLIAKQLAELGQPDIFALSEVDPRAFDSLKASGPNLGIITGASGRNDRLAILFDTKRQELLQTQQIEKYGEHVLNDGNHRAPLFARFRDRQSGQVFQVVVNHLARGKEAVRNEQAVGLREWARNQKLPTIIIGDLNLDYDFHTGRGNQAFIEIQRDGVNEWVKPAELIDTNWADFNRDGVDDYPDSMLDFAFVAGPAKDWKPVCKVIVRDGDFPDNKETSDHRPIELRLQPSTALAP